MLSILTKTTGAKWLAYLGVALLLVATVAQTAHFCGFQSLDLRDGTQLRPDSANTTLCMTCLMAQSVAAIVLSIVFSSVFRRFVVRQSGDRRQVAERRGDRRGRYCSCRVVSARHQR
jgi:hypothetical protein